MQEQDIEKKDRKLNDGELVVSVDMEKVIMFCNCTDK